jgi:AcrR family transcriptional regulator
LQTHLRLSTSTQELTGCQRRTFAGASVRALQESGRGCSYSYDQSPLMAAQTPEPSNIARRRATARGVRRSGYVDRRSEIVRTAAEVFKQRGYAGTTISHIAEALGTDRASLYYYVGSKEELFEEIVSEAVEVNLATAIAIRDGAGTAPEKLRRLIEQLMRSYADNYPVLYVLIQENLDHVDPKRSDWAQEMKRINREFIDVLIGIVQAGQREGTVRDSAPAWLLAYGIMGMVGWTNRWFNPGESSIDAAQIGSTFGDMVLAGIAVDGEEAARHAERTELMLAAGTTATKLSPRRASRQR